MPVGGSAAIEGLLVDGLSAAGVAADGTDFTGRSDYGPFIAHGIASGGVFTGAEREKTQAQAQKWGGTAGEAYDGCYHQACDTIENVDMGALDVNIDAIALAVLAYSYSTESVNGVPGKNIPGGLKLPVPAGPEGTTGSGGGHSHGEASLVRIEVRPR